MATKKATSAAPAVSSKSPSLTSPAFKILHARNVASRTIPETTATVASREERLRLSDDARKSPHYVLRCRNGYASSADGQRVTTKLSEAVVDTSLRNALIGAELYSSLAASEGPFLVERLIVESNGFATGSEPRDTSDLRSIFSPEATKWSGTRHNSALAECAEVEERRRDIIKGHMDALKRSETYKPFVDEYHADLASPKCLRPDWHLSLFGARLFYAGVIAGRNENGRRDPLGELLLDAPWPGLRHDSALAGCAETESNPATSETICDHLTMLTASPMFKFLVEGFEVDLAKPEALEDDWYLRQFAARLFYAGVIAGRRERRQRVAAGHLAMDAPCDCEPEVSVINPA